MGKKILDESSRDYLKREDKMKKLAMKSGIMVVALAVGFLLIGGAVPYAQEIKTVTIKAWTVGPDDPSITRKTNLEDAGKRLNKYLEAIDAKVRVKVEATFNTESWSSFKTANLLALGTGDPEKIADIIVTGHEMIGPYATAGYIVPLDDYIAKYPEVYNDFIPALWNSARFAGKIWGIPQDTECRITWFRKDKLREMGWSEEEINSLPKKVEAGEFTLDGLVDLGKKMLDAGVVKKGNAIWHRPTPGTDWFQFIFAYGGEIFDPDTGKLVVDKSATLSLFKYIKKLVDLGLTPSGMSTIAWAEIHSNWTKGKIGIFLTGGSWNWAEWIRSPYNIPEAEQWKNVGWFPIPSAFKGGKPVSVSHPLVHLITKASLNKDLAFLLVTLASSNDLNTKHALGSGHLAVRQSQVAYGEYAKAKYAKLMTEVLKYTHFAPNHEKAPFYWETLFKGGISAVETGAVSPEGALDFFVKRMKSELGDQVIVRE